jgi:enamine deaminase RidA (YjgF/YER057c/UK114 family)
LGSRAPQLVPRRGSLSERTLHLSAVICRADGLPESDYAAQVRLAFSNLEPKLTANGCIFDDIIDVTTFHIVNPVRSMASNPAAFAKGYNINERTARFAPRAV